MKNLLTIAVFSLLTSCYGPFGPSRAAAIKEATEQVRETMRVALPDVSHPEPYEYEDAGDCALVPGLSSSKETLRYQAEIPLPAGDNGLERQARAVKHWIDKGGSLRKLPYDTGMPPNEVNYRGGSIMAFAMPTRGRPAEAGASSTFYIVATTPCVPKEE